MLPYGDVWRASRRIFVKHFDPSNPSLHQPREIVYVRRFLGQLLQKPNDFLLHIRTYVLICHTSTIHAFHLIHVSLVGSATISMTYSINVRPYNDPYIKMAEEAMEVTAELTIAGAFLVDIIPILKYVPEWFPGARFQTQAAIMRKHVAMTRNTLFLAAEKLIVCDLLPFLILLDNMFSGQR